jgi:transcriptional regulator with XRE-family HTH domain
MVCPKCQSHILLSRFSPEEIWLIKARGLSYAEIGRLLNLSRERVRQLCKKYKAIEDAKLAKLAESDLDHLIKKAEFLENYLIADGKLTRRIDRRTKKKRILAELDKLKSKDI